MNLDDLAGVLSEMYENASDGDKVSMIHLFGIRYSSEIKNKGYTAGDIIKKTKLKNEKPMSDTYKTEISKGIRLADFVVDKEKLRDLLIGILWKL